jgi:signal transduction histidine kinase
MSRWWSSLPAKVIAAMLLTTLIALVVATTGLVVYDTRAYRQAITADLSTQAELVGLSASPALAFDDAKSAAENLALMQSRPGILGAALYKPSGQLFASYARPDVAGALPATPGDDGVRIERGEIWLVQPVVEKNERVGTVLLRARYELWARLSNYLVILATVMIASFGVALLVSATLQRRITAPILDITRVARQVMDRRDFSLRVQRTGTGEIDVLVDAFNAMLAEVGQQADELRQSNRHKDRFLATLAHELRNPLAPLQNGLSLLKMAPRPGIDVAKVREMMERQLRQMVRLIDDLLDISRIATDKLVLRKAPMDLRDAVKSALETLGPYVEERKHALEVQLPDRPVMVSGDLTRLSQVFANLIHNAAKFTPPGGRIRVTVAEDSDGIAATVVDDGIGIDPSMQERVFELFEQADNSLERTQAGLGVGLSLARRLLELHGGQLTARSAGRGRGTELSIRIPKATTGAEPAGAPADALAATRSHPRRVLIVDDNGDFADTLATMLGSMGHDVRVAHDGEQGLALANRFVPDIAFLDIGMPKLNGYELAARLRRNPSTRSIHLVAVTGWGQESDRRRANEAGFNLHLMKPVEVDRIVAVVDSLET